MNKDIESLVQAAAAGDEGALQALLERYLPQLRAYVRLRAGAAIRAQESASDIVQSVCREVLENAARFEHPNEGAFKNWMFATALRKIVDRKRYYTAQKRDIDRNQAEDGGERDERGLAECYNTFTAPSQRAIANEDIERIEAAFEQMPEDYREVITLAHLVGLSRKEIAEQMGKTEGAVRTTLFRALARLSDLLGDTGG